MYTENHAICKFLRKSKHPMTGVKASHRMTHSHYGDACRILIIVLNIYTLTCLVESARVTGIAVTPYQPNEKLHRLDNIIICRSSYYLIMEEIYTLLGLRSFRVYVLSSIRGISKPLFYAVCTDFRR